MKTKQKKNFLITGLCLIIIMGFLTGFLSCSDTNQDDTTDTNQNTTTTNSYFIAIPDGVAQ